MALKKQLIQIPMTDGLEQGKAPLLVQKGMFRLSNGVFGKEGTISKCTGMIDSSADTYTEDSMGVLNDKPVLFDSRTVRMPSGPVFDTTWIDTDDLFVANHSIEELGGISDVKNVSIAEMDAVRVVVFTDMDTSGTEADFCYTYNIVSGRRISWRNMGGSGGIRVINTGVRLLVINRETGGGLARTDVNSTTGVIGTSVSIAGPDAVSSTYRFDICRIGVSGKTMIATLDATAVDGEVWILDNDNTVHGPDTVALVGPRSLACFDHGLDAGGNEVAVALYADDTSGGSDYVVYALLYGNDLTQLDSEVVYTHATDPPIILCGGPMATLEDMIYIGVHTAAGGLNYHRTYRRSITIGTGTITVNTGLDWMYGFVPFSFPAIRNATEHYLLLQTASHTDDQSCFILVRSEGNAAGDDINGEIVARLLPGYGGYPRQSLLYGELCGEVIEATADKVWRIALTTKLADETAGAAIATVDLDKASPMSVDGGDRLLVGGSVGYDFDGVAAFESGFLFYPHAPGAAGDGSGSISGDFSYCLTYAYVDAAGAWHRSIPSEATDVTVTSATHTDVTCQTTKAHRKALANRIIIEVWRTEDSGSYFYKVGEVNNSKNAATVNFADTVTDAVLLTNEGLYAQPGGSTLEYMAPPPWNVGCMHQGRSFVVDMERPDTRIVYSNVKSVRAGYQWNDGLYIDVPADGGAITALASYSDKLIIFKANRTYGTYGSGFTATGSGSGYATPVLLDPAIGCSVQKSVVECPQGILFMSDDFAWLMGQSGTFSPIGKQAEYAFSQVTVRRGLLVADKEYVVFLTSGDAVVYHYLAGIWSTFSWDGCIDGCVAFGGILGFIRGDGTTASTVVCEDRTVYTYRTSQYSMVLETGWISPAGPGGWARVYGVLLGGHLENATQAWKLRCKFAFDGAPYWKDSQTFTATGLPKISEADHYGSGLASSYEDDAMVLDFATSQQRCTSMRIHVSDESVIVPPDPLIPDDPGSTLVQGAGFSLSWITLVVGVASGAFRMGATRKA